MEPDETIEESAVRELREEVYGVYMYVLYTCMCDVYMCVCMCVYIYMCVGIYTCMCDCTGFAMCFVCTKLVYVS